MFFKNLAQTRIPSWIGFAFISITMLGTTFSTELVQRKLGFFMDEVVPMTTLPRPTTISCQHTLPDPNENWERVYSTGMPYMGVDDGVFDTDYYVDYQVSTDEVYVYCPLFERTKRFLGSDNDIMSGSFTENTLHMNLGGTAIRYFGLQVYVSN